ncbi:MAG TPA: tetratricopeptide repeat protein, partial [Sorangium sp.]|nr:tetratricopeptide repeat protein [Sorangium sp.]
DTAPHREVAIAYLFKMGAIYEDILDDMRSALQVYQRILTRQNKHLGAIQAIQRTAERAGEINEWVAALDKEVALEKDPARVIALQFRAAEVVAEYSGDNEGAAARLRAILKRSPKHAASLTALARVERRLGNHAALLEVYQSQLGIAADDRARVALLIQIAQLCERTLGDDAAATQWYRQAVTIEPGQPLARSGLLRLLRKQGDYRALVTVLEAELASAAGAPALAAAAVQLGEVYETHLNEPQPAAAAYRKALDAQPGFRPALDALVRVLALRGDWVELGSAMNAKADATQDERMATEARLAASVVLADRLHKRGKATEVVEQLVEAHPDNLSALLVLEGLYVAADETSSLAGLFARQARVFAQPSARVAALVSQVRLLKDDTHSDDVLRVCRAIVAIDPDNLFALHRLRRLAHQQQDVTLAAEVNARLSGLTQNTALRAEYLMAYGEALRATDPATALSVFKRAEALAPDSLRAIRGALAASMSMGDAASMVAAYQSEAVWTRSDTLAADLLVQSAAVLARLGDQDAAVEAVTRALARCPDHAAAADMLSVLLTRLGRIELLVGQLSRAAHAAKKSVRKVALWQQVAALQADGVSDVGAAIRSVQRALEAKPDHHDSLMLLAGLYTRDSQYDEAAAAYHKLVAVDDDAVAAHLALGRIYTKHRPDAAQAHTSLQRVLRHDENNREALALTLQLHLDKGDRTAAAAAAERLLEAAGDDRIIAAWALVEIGKLELKANDAEAAANALLAAVEVEGLGGSAARLYRRMVEKGRDAKTKPPWERYLQALRDYLVAVAAPVQSLPPVYLEMARVQHSQLDAAADAFLTLQEGLARCQGEPLLRLARAKLLETTGRVEDALMAFRALASDHPDVAAAWRGLARLLQEHGRPAEASMAAGVLVV